MPSPPTKNSWQHFNDGDLLMTDIEKDLVRNMDSADRCLLWLQKTADLYDLLDLFDVKDFLFMKTFLAYYRKHKGVDTSND